MSAHTMLGENIFAPKKKKHFAHLSSLELLERDSSIHGGLKIAYIFNNKYLA